MLSLESPIYFINNLQIHRDFQNPNQFYYFPPAPRIHYQNGAPAFQLLKYTRDVTDNPLMPADTAEQVGGGFLTFTVDIGVDADTIEDTKNQLSSFSAPSAKGELTLAPVPFHTGSVRLVALGSSSEPAEARPTEPNNAQPNNAFVEKVFGTTKPTLYGDNLALFGLHLKQEGIALIEDSFRNGGGLLGVVYDLAYTGIRPAIEVKVTVDFKRVYNRFEAQLGLQYATIGAEIGATLEWLQEQGAIDIQITQYDTDPATVKELRKEAMDLVKQEVISKMFKPSLQVPTSSAPSQGSLMDQVIRVAGNLRNQPSAQAANRPAPSPSGRTQEGDPGATAMNRQGTAGAQGGGGSSGGGSTSSSGFALTFSLKYVRQEEQKKVTFDFRVNQAVNRTASPQGSLQLLLDDLDVDSYIREVNLDDPFFRELKAKVGIAGDFEALGIDKVVVNATYQPDLEAPIVHTDGWTFNSSDEAAQLFNVLLDKNRPVRRYDYKIEAFLKDLSHIDSKTRVLTSHSTSEQRELILHPANEFKPLFVAVELGALDWTQIKQVDVKLKYSDSAHDFQAEQLFSFSENQSNPRQWIVYPPDTDLRTYSVAYTYTLADGSYFEQSPETQLDEGIVVPPPYKGTRRLRITPAVDAEEVQEVLAEILFEQGGYRFYQELVFEQNDFATRVLEIPMPDPDPARDTYQAKWSILTKDFQTYNTDWTEKKESRLILDDGIHTVSPVSVELVESLSDVGLTALLLTLESLDAEGEVIDTDHSILRGSETQKTFDLLIPKGTLLKYRYRFIKFMGDRREEEFGPFESDRTELFLSLSS